ncbi:hypothetical protein DRE_03511 [Drechslerella stenobrocha 248]|uniref:U3 small nucleolar RNA-associated protein 10 n=1 Tax=Drechslerella stenobrocha 248 TaxID=1043628 RepID=W7I406_9PEZI|nr:hypothetical protein DRE_03511 [Drechslerella stenobrocha 248]
MLDRTATRSRTGVTPDDVARQMLPLISESLQAGAKMPEFQIATYMLLSLLASRVVLEDAVICAAMESVVSTWTPETITPAIAALSLLSQQREGMTPVAPVAVAAAFLKVGNVADKLLTLGEKYRADKLSVGLCLALLREEALHGSKACVFVKAIFQRGRITDSQREALMVGLVDAVLKNGGAGGPVKELLAGFKDNTVLAKVLKAREDELDMLELALGMVLVDDPALEPLAIEAPPERKEKTKVDTPKIQERFDTAVAALPEQVGEVSLLASAKSAVYPLLCQALLAAAANRHDLPPVLFAHPTLASPTLRATFILRFSLDAFPVVAKEVALERLKDDIKNASQLTDYQALLPYLLATLLDTSQRVRKGAILCIAAFYASYKSVDKKTRKTVASPPIFARDDIYGSSSGQVKWMATEELYKFVDALSSSGVEGCMLDNTQIARSFAGAISALKKTAIRSHVLNAPLLPMKTALLTLMNAVPGSARTGLLLPLFAWWRAVAESKQASGTTTEVGMFENQLIAIVDVKDHGDGLDALVGAINAASAEDPKKKAFAAKTGKRLQVLWNHGVRPEVKPGLALSLLRLVVGGSENIEALDVLRNITLSADTYTTFINEVVPDHPADNLRQNTRRRRSFSREVETRLPQQMKELTIVLELLEGDRPERFPELLPVLFGVLGKALEYNEAASPLGGGDYMTQVLLGCLTSVVAGYKQQHPGKPLDGTNVRADLVVSCIRSTASPQLQNAALLLIAALADLAADVVLHSVMPIFTFMGANVLRQDDEYSAHVIEQTIHRVIPPLLRSLRSQVPAAAASSTRGVDASVAEIMGSFVAAFQHVPAHRRMKLYMSLSQSMGGNEYLYVLLLLLGEKAVEERVAGRHMAVTVTEFCEGFCGMFAAEEQVGAFVRYLDVCVQLATGAGDAAAGKVMLLFRDKQLGEERVVALAVGLMEMLGGMLGSRKLRNQVANAHKSASGEVALLKERFVDAVKRCLQAGQCGGAVETAAEACLKALLDLLPIPLFVTITGELIKDAASPYRAGILATFKSRIAAETKKASQDAALEFLPQLEVLLKDAASPAAVRAETISCITVITEKYGKDKPDAVVGLLDTITGETAFGSDDEGLQVLSMLCLIAAVRCLGGRIIPALPRIAPPAIALLEKEMEQETPAFLVHNAVWPLLGDLVNAIPNFMPSYLERMLRVAYTAASKEEQTGNDTDEDEEDEAEALEERLAAAPAVREELFRAVAKKLPAKPLVKAVLNSWEDATKAGLPALRLVFSLLGNTIQAVPKQDFGTVQDMLFKLFLLAFDIRSLPLVADADADADAVDEVQGMMYAALLQMVFKLNDKVFRPFFARLVKWTGEGGSAKKDSRLQTFYGFLNNFQDGLGSIVTNYYALVLPNAIKVLDSARQDNRSSGFDKVYTLTLTSLIKSFTNDQDEFWQNPTNFNVIQPALLAQLELARDDDITALTNNDGADSSSSSSNVLGLIVQAIGELSVAAHTEEHDKTINTAVSKLFHNDVASVRFAAVRAMMELYERHGEEWIGLLPETMPAIAELMEDDDERVDRETHRLIVKIEEYYGEKLETLLM